MKPIIFDTDIGDDIDDALALTMAIHSPELMILGVTTVHAEVELRSRIAAKMLTILDRRDIAIATGISMPINREPRWGWAQSEGRLLEDDEVFPSIIATPGPEFIRDSVMIAPNPVTLLAIGPLTNIAAVLTQYPEVKSRLSEIVVMGGLIDRPATEYNIIMDPEAAAIVFSSGVPMRVIPLDVTENCLMPASLLERLAASRHPAHRMTHQLIGYWREIDGRDIPVLHDPLAVGCLLRPELYQFEGYAVQVGLSGDHYGVTRATPDDHSPVRICTGLDYSSFAEFFEARLLGAHDMGG